jgi:hypothetical protein
MRATLFSAQDVDSTMIVGMNDEERRRQQDFLHELYFTIRRAVSEAIWQALWVLFMIAFVAGAANRACN